MSDRRMSPAIYWTLRGAFAALAVPGAALRALRRLLARLGDTTGRICELEQRAERAEWLLSRDARIVRLVAEEGCIEADCRYPMVAVLAEQCAMMLDRPGADNFVTSRLHSARIGAIEVTVRRSGGRTPADAINELRAKIAEMEAGR